MSNGNQGRLIFLLDERSMKVLLEDMLPRFFPGLCFLCLAHEGKQDLERSIPRKLRAWQEPGVRFVVVRDSDNHPDCRLLKQHLVAICQNAGRGDTVVRLACQELEAWYLGDPAALAQAFNDNRLQTIGVQAKFRDPDSVVRPSAALEEIIPSFQKILGARQIAGALQRNGNSSRSFNAFVNAIEQLAPSHSRCA